MSDDEPDRDPFGRLEESAGDREGDPFESLADPDDDERADSDPVTSANDDERVDADAGVPPDEGRPDFSGGATPEDDGSGPTDPAGGPDAESGFDPAGRIGPGTPEVDSDGPSSDDPFTSPESSLRHVDVGDVDEDEVWAAISDAQARGSVADAGGRTYAEVSKHRYCETCTYFSAPPDVACSHDGTEILSFLDAETVRLVDCPVVAERRDLERRDSTDR